MILISIRPFAFKKLFALVATLICLSTASCFAAPMFLPVASTPYDQQMNRIRPALLSARNGNPSCEVSLNDVNLWIEDLSDIPYGYHMDWKTPFEVESRQPADCKGKAVALYQRMQTNGARNLRLEIGKRAPSSRMTHTWAVWETDRGSYVLDPTFYSTACRAEQEGERSYVPLYAYEGNKKFRAESSTRYATN